MKIVPSEYQKAVYDFVSSGNGSGYINAVAGSGKTTTIVNASGLIPSNESTVFLAFNKKIAAELESRLPSTVKVSTFHALCLQAWRKYRNNKVRVDGDKLKVLSWNLSKENPRYKNHSGTACQLVSKAKALGIGIFNEADEQSFYEIADYFDIDLPDNPIGQKAAIEAAITLLEESNNASTQSGTSYIDFDDMLYMPLKENIEMPRFDNVIIDESQDTNKIQREIVKKMLNSNGRLLAVGDEKQAIYGFRGADSNAVKLIKDEFDCQEFPLFYCYRCAKEIIKLAQTIVPYIQAPDSAIDGTVMRNAIIEEQKFENSDVILCRNTKPLVDFAFYLIGKGIGCKVLGRDIGGSLIKLIEKMRANSIENLYEKLEKYREAETVKYMKKYQNEKIDALEDKVNTIYTIIGNLEEHRNTINDLCVKIETMFGDENETRNILTLSTVHKSKGLEWKRVFIYRHDLLPSKYAIKDWQVEQERNLQYVAYTRAKESLVILSGEVAKNNNR